MSTLKLKKALINEWLQNYDPYDPNSISHEEQDRNANIQILSKYISSNCGTFMDFMKDVASEKIILQSLHHGRIIDAVRRSIFNIVSNLDNIILRIVIVPIELEDEFHTIITGRINIIKHKCYDRYKLMYKYEGTMDDFEYIPTAFVCNVEYTEGENSNAIISFNNDEYKVLIDQNLFLI